MRRRKPFGGLFPAALQGCLIVQRRRPVAGVFALMKPESRPRSNTKTGRGLAKVLNGPQANAFRGGLNDGPNLPEMRLLTELDNGRIGPKGMSRTSEVFITLCCWTKARLHTAHSYLSFAAVVVLFVLVITPVALLLRAVARDPLRLRKARDESYWRCSERVPRTLTEMAQLF